MLLHYFSIINVLESIRSIAEEIYAQYEEDSPDSQEEFDMTYYISRIHDLDESIITAKENDPLKTIIGKSKLEQHLVYASYGPNKFRNRYLIKDNIRDMLNGDLPHIVQDVQKYFNSTIDKDLFEKLSPLLKNNHIREATQDAFIMLSQRLKAKYPIPDSVHNDQTMIDYILGKKNTIPVTYNGEILSDTQERNSLQNFLKGNYGLFRNKSAHEINIPEGMGTIALENINFLLIALDL